MGDISPERKSGCGLLNAVFGHRVPWPRKSDNSSQPHSIPHQKSQRAPSPKKIHNHGDRVIERPAPNHTKSPYTPIYHQPGSQGPAPTRPKPDTGPLGYAQARKAPPLGLSGELDSMIADHQKSRVAGNFVRASSGNVMLYGNLGNLRQPANTEAIAVDYRPKVASPPRKKKEETQKPGSLCRAISTRMDPEELKIMGNEDYKNGRFSEALSLYEAAISIDPNKASYRSNKSAALTALGNLLEAAFECREAIRIDPFYQRAHNRLATLYVRLGEPEKAVYHFKQAGSDADPDAMVKAKNVQFHLTKCTEAMRQRDWKELVKEINFSISSGADSAPLILALKAETLLKLNRHQEAIETMANGPNFEVDDCMKLFGPIGCATLLVARAQVDMMEGRFDDAVAAAQRACRLDGNNKEANAVLRRTTAVASAREKGNRLFRVSKYQEACNAYGEGLQHDPFNAVLLCNRAACRSKLNLYGKAIEDCNAAINVRPGYSKARLRRADCYAKMENWGACVQDCEVLIRGNPDDEEANRLLSEAKKQLK